MLTVCKGPMVGRRMRSHALTLSCIRYRDKGIVVTRSNKRQMEEKCSPSGPLLREETDRTCD